MLNEKVFFLDDEPRLDLKAEDAFGHAFYARTLYEILENTPGIKPYAIGLFGKWGVGKTSIINELKRLIEVGNKKKKEKPTHKYRIEVLDAWEYSEQNFRREFQRKHRESEQRNR